MAIKNLIKSLLKAGVPRIRPRIVREFAHDPQAFTQGLAYWGGHLYESTGKPGQSSVRCIDIRDGRVLLHRSVQESDVWAEGLAVFDGRLIQLTWKHEKAIIYSLPDLLPDGEIQYEGEGWGLAAAGKFLVMTDGSNRLVFRDKDFVAKKEVRVSLRGIAQRKLNDIEVVDETVYANVWYGSEILAISARDGKVTGVCDCRNLLDAEQPTGTEAVLNGIAFDPSRGTFLLTGKYWKRFFEVEFIP